MHRFHMHGKFDSPRAQLWLAVLNSTRSATFGGAVPATTVPKPKATGGRGWREGG